MKKIGIILIAVMAFASCCRGEVDRIVRTEVPQRPAGQNDVLELRAEPIPVVKVAFIGLGMRGPGAVRRMTFIPGVEVVALCDVEKKRVEASNKMLAERGFPRAQEFYGDTAVWRQVCALPDVDLIYVATNWQNHAIIGKQAMEDGKHVAIEVPAAMSLDEIWSLIDTSERTRKHCMQLENCVYDFFELTTLNMAQQGLLGEILHAEGAYIHNLEPYWNDYWYDWRLEFNKGHRGDVYPTHGLGPVCQALNIHRGDKMNLLVSMDTKAVGIPAYIEKTRGEKIDNFRNGDHTMTMIGTERGKTIMIQHDVASPRPYNRLYQISGTDGFANKYPVEGYMFRAKDEAGNDTHHENLDAHDFISHEQRMELMEKYRHPITKDIEALARQVGGHGGMDFIMDYRLIYCLQKGLPLDMDVYDLAEWCCLIPLTALSLENGSAPVEIPDFTRGAWDKVEGLKFAL